MTGRKPHPFQVVEKTNDKKHCTKSTLKARQDGEPKLKSARLICPSSLSPEAKKEWKRLVRLYKELDNPLMTDLDTNALEVYCEAMATYRKAMENVNKSQIVYKSEYGPRVNPWLTAAYNAANQIKKYGEMLLLDPISRARIGLAKAKQEELDPMELLLNKRSGNG